MTTAGAILLVEDNEDDIFLMKRALKSAEIKNPVITLEDGQQAIDYLSGVEPYTDRSKHPLPVLVFLDLKLPIVKGHEVLAWIRSQPELKNTIVVVLTSSNEQSDLKKAYGLGANSYVVKPPTAQQLTELAKAFKWYWLEFNLYETESR